MKKIFVRALSLALAGVMTALTLASCGGGLKEFEGDLREKYDYDLSEYVKPGKYKGLKVKIGSDTISKEQIEREIMKYNVLYTTTVDGNEWVRLGEGVPVEKGNIAEVKYQGYVDGVAVNDLKHSKEEGLSMAIGEEKLMVGIDEHILGMKIGEKKTVEITVPDPCYEYPHYVGKTVKFELELAGIRATELEPYGEGLFDNFGCHNADEFESQLISEVKRVRGEKLEDYVITRALGMAMDSFEVKKYPEKELKEVKDGTKTADEEDAKKDNVTFEEYIKTKYDMTPEEYDEKLDAYAKDVVFTEMVIYYIARKEQIALTNAAFDEKAEELAAEVGLSTPAEYVSYMSASGYTEFGVRELIWVELVNDFIYKNTEQVKEG